MLKFFSIYLFFTILLFGNQKAIIPLKKLEIEIEEIKSDFLLEDYEIPFKYKNFKKDSFDTVTLKSYIKSLLNCSYKLKEKFYDKKIKNILSAIKKNRYNIDLYLDGFIRTGNSFYVNLNQKNVDREDKYTEIGSAIYLEKILLDREKKYSDIHYEILEKRLSNFQFLEEKEKLLILASDIYINLFEAQEKLNLIKKVYHEQKKILDMEKNRVEKGEGSFINYIDLKDDFLNLKKLLLSQKKIYLYHDYIFRSSIESKSTKPFLLSAPKINSQFENISPSVLQQITIKNSTKIKKIETELKINEINFLEKNRIFFPEIKFYSYAGYQLENDKTFYFSRFEQKPFWEIGIDFKIPLYNKNILRKDKEKSKIEILKTKKRLKDEIKKSVAQSINSYLTIKKIDRHLDILEKQIKLMQKKIKILKEEFKVGYVQHKTISDTLKKLLNYKLEYITLQNIKIKENIILSILLNQRIF